MSLRSPVLLRERWCRMHLDNRTEKKQAHGAVLAGFPVRFMAVVRVFE